LLSSLTKYPPRAPQNALASSTPGGETPVAQRAGRHQQAPARPRDHLIRWRQMLEGVVGDRPHALGDGLILQMDAVDPAVDRVAALGRAVATVRTHLHRLFEKTGTGRQADLVKLVAGYCSAP
jgi:hypothetical protein